MLVLECGLRKGRLRTSPGVDMEIQDKDILKEPEPQDEYGPRPILYGPPPPRRVQRISFDQESVTE